MKIKKMFLSLLAVLTIFAFSFGVVPSANAATYGGLYIYNNADTAYNAVASLNSSTFVVVYRDNNNSGYGTAKIGTVSSGTTITYGDPYVFNSDATSDIAVTMLDNDQFVVAYYDSNDPVGGGKARIGTVTGGDTIAYGSVNEFNPTGSSTSHISVDRLDDTYFVFAYRTSDPSGQARIGQKTGSDTIATGSASTFKNSATTEISVRGLDSNHFAVAYRDDGNSLYGTAEIGTTSGSSISSWGGEALYNDSGNTTNNSISVLSDLKFVVSYSDGGNSFHGTSNVGTVTGGNTIAFGGEEEFNDEGSTGNIGATELDGNRFVVTYSDGFNSYYGRSNTGTVSGSSISFASKDVVLNNTVESNSASNLSNSDFVVAFDVGTGNIGNAIIGQDQGSNGGAVPEFSTYIALALALGAGLIIVLVVRSRYLKRKETGVN